MSLSRSVKLWDSDWSLTERQGNLEVMASVNLLIMKPLHLLCGTSIMPMLVAALYELTSPTPIPSSKARPLCEASCSMGVIQEAAGVITVSTKTATVTDMIILAINPKLKTQILSCQVCHPVFP